MNRIYDRRCYEHLNKIVFPSEAHAMGWANVYYTGDKPKAYKCPVYRDHWHIRDQKRRSLKKQEKRRRRKRFENQGEQRKW